MPRKIAQNTLNATTLDILNVIRQNAGYDYQQNVPVVQKATDIPRVGEIIYGTPAFANQFLNALVNRIAIVRMESATFNNPYVNLKKGFLEFGETIEDIFVGIAKVVDYSAEKADGREFKRTIPDVKSIFHVMNWRVMYPITIQDSDLKQAFLSADGVADLIAKIVEQVYTAAEYDEFLLFKYLIIKGVNKGAFKPIGLDSNIKNHAIAYRGTSNRLPFMSDMFNESGVKTNTDKGRQIIFMDAEYNASFDVEVLASAFNMDKTDFMGRLHLIDDWTHFDNDRFAQIRDASDGIELVTDDELEMMGDVRAVLVDENWFQIYDNKSKFTEKYVASGDYWNYFYHTWKTISYSPFANAVVFVSNDIALPTSIDVTVASKDVSDVATVLTFDIEADTTNIAGLEMVQTQALTTNGIAVQKYGAIIIPSTKVATDITLEVKIGDTTYTSATTISGASNVGTKVTLTKSA